MHDHARTSLEWYKTAVGWQVGLSTSAIAGLSVFAYKLHEILGAPSLLVLVPITLFGFSAAAGVLLHFHVIDRIASSELLEEAEKRANSWGSAEREKASKDVETEQRSLDQKRKSVRRFHRYCVFGFYVAAWSCLLMVPVLVIGLLGRDAQVPAPCCPYALLEGDSVCSLAARSGTGAGVPVTVDAEAIPVVGPGTSLGPDQAQGEQQSEPAPVGD